MRKIKQGDNQSGIVIRKANSSDIPLLIEWVNKLREHVLDATSDVYLLNFKEGVEDNVRNSFYNMLDSKDHIVFIAENNDVPSGFIIGTVAAPFVRDSSIERIGYIGMCWVVPGARRSGIASRLVKELEQWLRKNGVKFVEVNYLIGNKEAEVAWEKMGYVPYRMTSRKSI